MSGDIYDAPNQEVVRPDGSPPWEEGDGGSEHPTGEPTDEGGPVDELDAMTKDQLLDEADARGIAVTTAMTKDEIKAAIRAG